MHVALSAAAACLRGTVFRLCTSPAHAPAAAFGRDSSADALTAAQSTQQSGPGPSPGSSSSCEDSCKPPLRNCFRLVLLGSSRVGKTSIVARFLNSKFDDSYTPTIEDFHRKLYRIRGEVYQLDILDTSGNHPFPAMRRLSFLTGDLFVLVFSLDSRESFEEAVRLREQILETKLSACASANGTGSGRRKAAVPRVPMVLVGNKSDKEMRTVSTDEAMAYVDSQDDACVFVETSAKRNLRIDDLFYELFVVAGLPLEMAPNTQAPAPSVRQPCTLPTVHAGHKSKKCTLSIKRRLSDACGVVAPPCAAHASAPTHDHAHQECSLGSSGGGGVGGGAGARARGRSAACVRCSAAAAQAVPAHAPPPPPALWGRRGPTAPSDEAGRCVVQ
ncbi:Ras-related protein Rap1 [Gryllus bimaculatus]|nr:Ras-related protein Rap1 [Gryllus bimaculatus]